MAFDSAVGSGVQLIKEQSIEHSIEYDHAKNNDALQITKNQSELPPTMNNGTKLHAQ